MTTPLGEGGSERPPLPLDPPATFVRANARFPSGSLTAPTVIFWLTPGFSTCTAVQVNVFAAFEILIIRPLT